MNVKIKVEMLTCNRYMNKDGKLKMIEEIRFKPESTIGPYYTIVFEDGEQITNINPGTEIEVYAT